MESKSNLPSGKKAAKPAGTKKASKQSKASEPMLAATPATSANKKASAKKAPAKQAPAKNAAANRTAKVVEAASKKAPAKKAAKVVKVPAKQALAKKAASKKAASTKAPAKKAAKVVKALAKKAPAKKAAKVVEAPAKQVASTKAPAKQAAKVVEPASKKAPAKQAAKVVKVSAKAPAKKPKPVPTSPLNGAPSPSTPPQLQVGDAAPSFELADQTGKLVSSSELAGKPYVLYFYPKDNTPGCTTEACAFRDLHPSFGEIGVNVFGVSADSSKSHAGFAGKYELPFTLLADTDKQLINAYGTWVSKKNYGRDYMGIQRSTFLIDAAGTLKHAWRSVKVNGHAQAVLEEARKLA